MSGHIHIPFLGAKLDLLLRSDRTPIKTNHQLMTKLSIGKDYLSRLRNDTRTLTEEKFLELCTLFNLEQRVWFEELDSFGKRLGFTRKQIATIAGMPIPGIDFSSRIRDMRVVTDLCSVISGFWESYYYSASRTGQKLVSRDLLVVRDPNEDAFIECEVIDGLFRYTGWCFPIRNHLYFVLEKDELYNEIIVYTTNHPDRQPPRLYGVILCLSGGVDEINSVPCAAKVAFRYIGKAEDMRRQHGLGPDQDVQAYLEQKVPAYVDPLDPLEPEVRNIINDISNLIQESEIPSVLRMKK